MIILDTTTKQLEILLGGTVATVQLPFVSTYVDVQDPTTFNPAIPLFNPIAQDGVSNNITAVIVMTAPAASTQRQLKYFNVYNADTQNTKVTVRYNNNGTTRILGVWNLIVGYSLIYNQDSGWVVLDGSGAKQGIGLSGYSGISGYSGTSGFSGYTGVSGFSGVNITLPYVAKTAIYTFSATDYTVDCTANSFTVTLPTAVGISGRIYVLKKSANGTTITLATTSSQTIDGSTTQVLTAGSKGSLTVQSNGANWIII